jgi:hypothetical protein
MLTQKRCGIGRDAEAGLKELVVRLVNRGIAGRHGESVENHAHRVNGRNVTILANAKFFVFRRGIVFA